MREGGRIEREREDGREVNTERVREGKMGEMGKEREREDVIERGGTEGR